MLILSARCTDIGFFICLKFERKDVFPVNRLENKQRKMLKTVFVCLIVAALLSAMATMAFANGVTVTWGGGDLTPNAHNILNTPALKQIMNIITTLVNPVASVVVGLCIFGIIFSSNSRQSETLLNSIKSVVIAFFLINGIKMFLYFALWASGAGTHVYTFS
jgi:hypothetical protein